MDRLSKTSGQSLWMRLALHVLASPVYAVRFAGLAATRYRFLRIATAAGMQCECGAWLSLVGLWKCSCGFTYRGHLLRRCPVCDSVPCVIRCFRCGVTTKLSDAE